MLGYAPVCQFLKSGDGVINVMFGPMVDHISHKPIEPGKRFPACSFYAKCGLYLNDTQSDTWATNPRCLNAVICHRPEKNHLFLPPEEDYDNDVPIDAC